MSEERKRKIVAFPTMILIESLEKPNTWETYNAIDGEPVDWTRRMEFALINSTKGQIKK